MDTQHSVPGLRRVVREDGGGKADGNHGLQGRSPLEEHEPVERLQSMVGAGSNAASPTTCCAEGRKAMGAENSSSCR